MPDGGSSFALNGYAFAGGVSLVDIPMPTPGRQNARRQLVVPASVAFINPSLHVNSQPLLLFGLLMVDLSSPEADQLMAICQS